MELFGKHDGLADRLQGTKTRDDVARQVAFSAAFGIAAFLAFCALRPKWTSLYSARKKRRAVASSLPVLPKTFFGWIPVVYNITEEEVLHTAGLDAFVFLAFLKLCIKYGAILLFFALIVVYPVHRSDLDSNDRSDEPEAYGFASGLTAGTSHPAYLPTDKKHGGDNSTEPGHWLGDQKGHDWTQFVFVYLYTFIAVYLIVKETQRMIRIRQKHLATQSSVSDRTVRLSGIPEELRDETKLKETIENLEIGRVESVTLCRNWSELDDLMEERSKTLRRLEESWSVYLGTGKASRKLRRQYRGEEEANGDEEQAGLLSGDEIDDGAHVIAYNKPRPDTRIWYGFMSLQSRKVDAIDYYEERLRRLDERIKISRKKEFSTTSLAFVTLDSTAACQMACQAIIDPEPMKLIASPSPPSNGIVWRNTYLSRRSRMSRAWSITAFIIVLTLFWSLLLFPLAGAQSVTTIKALLPAFGKWLEKHKTAGWGVTNGVPTLLVALLNSIVPYLYEYLSYKQGMTSLGDLEMSLISKNFFFTLFNLLIVFTLFGTAREVGEIWKGIDDNIGDLRNLPRTLFNSLGRTSLFYLNYLVLQTLGLFPFRLLQFGSVSLYPIYRMMAKTPRDYSELAQPSTFTYGFYIPQTLFTLTICVVYSVLENAELIQLIGVLYFCISSFVYKYQLLYSMDHRQFSSGRAWPMMCLRFIIALILFQLVAIGNLGTDEAFVRLILVAPLVFATIWFAIWYKRTYEPLMQNIALRTLRDVHEIRMEESVLSGSGEEEDSSRSRNSMDRPARSQYVNPSLIAALEEPWLARTTEREAESHGNRDGSSSVGEGVALMFAHN